MTAAGGTGAMPGLEVVVFSRTLPPATHKGVVITNDDPGTVVAGLKKRPGKDIWLFGGGELFRTLLDAGLVDSVEVAVIPVLLGSGVPLLPPGGSTKLVLADQRILPKSGIVALSYVVPRSRRHADRITLGYIKPAGRATAAKSAAKKRKTPARSRKPPRTAARKGRRG